MFPYRLLTGAARAVAPALAGGSSKLARGVAGRRRAHELLAAWGREARDPDRVVAWFHAPSVGEGFQAKAVIEALRERRPGVQIVFTYFSPSAESFAETVGADVVAYLPWDLRGPMTLVLDTIRPDVVVFTKTEVWPVLVLEARRRRIPVAMVGATVPDGAGRMRWAARTLLRPTWEGLRLACAIDDEDALRLGELGVANDVVYTTGDPGIDSAAARLADPDADASFLEPFFADPRPTLVAGSTWPAGEDVLRPALTGVRREVPGLRVILAPHEPEPARVASLLEDWSADGWAVATLADVEDSGSAEGVDMVVVDRVGVLARLYRTGSVAYVGGGYHDGGLHSVLEPAAAGVAVVFGPKHRNARAAGDLLERGGAKLAANAREMAAVVGPWLAEPENAKRVGDTGRAYIEEHLGAAARTAVHVDELIAAEPSPNGP